MLKRSQARERMLSQIRSAFKACQHPGWDEALYGNAAWQDEMSQSEGELENLSYELRPTRPWNETDPISLRGSGIVLLSVCPQAIGYFLAAHLWHAVSVPEQLDDGVDSLLLWLEGDFPDEPRRALQLASLSHPQRAAIRAFIDYVSTYGLGNLYISNDIQQLRTRWAAASRQGPDSQV
ncbi:MAG: hypothetical protein U1D55_05050 [Phycisphaerae bacterium]